MQTTEELTVARELLGRAAARSQRSNVAYAPEFIRTMNYTADAPITFPLLSQLIQGGRGGEVRLKLYLLLTMIATQRPFDIRNPPTPLTMARTLALPQATGSRRINGNLNWLEYHKLIKRTKRPGLTAAIQLLDLNGNEKPMPDPRSSRPYVTIPIEFWSEGWLLALSPTAIAVLFAVIERLGGQKIPMYMTRPRHQSYNLSHDTWTRGRKELEKHYLLKVTRTPQGDDYNYRRLRNSYWVDKERLLTSPM
jgi:hypothetical protein